MTKLLLLMAVGAVTVGCGPDYAGIYDGNLTANETCSDGSGSTVASDVTWTIADNNGVLTVALGGLCDPMTAHAKGNVATFDTKTCPPRHAGALIGTTTLSGAMTLDEPSLSISILGNTAITGAATGSCSSRATGILIRRPK